MRPPSRAACAYLKLGTAAIIAAMAIIVPASGAATLAARTTVVQGTAGRPWTGARGRPVTVAQLMARPPLAGAPGTAAPAAPVSARRSAPRATPGLAAPANAASAPPRITFAPITSFLGASLADSEVVPPDAMGAAGPTQFLLIVNGRVRTFDKVAGTADGVLDTTTDSFFAPFLSGTSTFDPRVRYDRLSGRWFVTMITFNRTAGNLQPANEILIAVSSGSTITSASSFTFFAFQQDSVTPTGNDAGCFIDSNTLGLDVNALYIGGDVVCVRTVNGQSQPVFVDSTQFVVRKSSVVSGGPLVVTGFRDLTGGVTAGPFAPVGADNEDPAATAGYVVGVDVLQLSHLALRRISDPGGAPSMSANFEITVSTTAIPISVPHQGSDGRNLDAGDDRLTNAVVRNGVLWTVQAIRTDLNGQGSDSGDRDAARWHQIRHLDTTPDELTAGTDDDSSPTNPLSYWNPSINVSLQGNMVVGGSVAGATHFADGWTAYDHPFLPNNGQIDPPTFTSSSAAYNPVFQGFQDNPHRWGDYSFTSLDPDDGMTMWTVQEYTNAPNSWGVRVARVPAPPPADFGATPNIVLAGQPSVSVTVQQFNQPCCAIFDPGPGYPRHVSASVGSGVVVNSVRYVPPSAVVLDLDTTHAIQGAQADVTITNPDGQSTTETGLLKIDAGTGLLRATTNPPLPSQILVDGTPRDSWGLNWALFEGGVHTVAFTHVEGYTEPAPQTVQIPTNGTATLVGNFVQRGSMRVVTSPAVPAAISVDGTARDDWGLWTDLPAGSHQVCFGPAAGFLAPPCQTVTLTAGALSQVTGAYTASQGAPGATGTGQLRVTTSPALASQILVNGVPMDSWGLNWVDLPPGSYTVSFTHVEGYTEPADQVVTVATGAVTQVTGMFTHRGSLRVITSPAVPANISLNDLPFINMDNWGVWTDVPVGDHQICFGDAPGFSRPPCQTVTISAGQLTTVTGTFTPTG